MKDLVQLRVEVSRVVVAGVAHHQGEIFEVARYLAEQAIREYGAGALALVKDALGIESPSEVARHRAEQAIREYGAWELERGPVVPAANGDLAHPDSLALKLSAEDQHDEHDTGQPGGPAAKRRSGKKQLSQR